MKYVILIHHNPASKAIWDGMSGSEQAEGLKAYQAIVDDLTARGELLATEALADPSMGRRLPADPGQSLTDGPFGEAKEHLAGFFLVDCESFERALEIGRSIPEAPLGLVEVRPVMTFALAEA